MTLPYFHGDALLFKTGVKKGNPTRIWFVTLFKESKTAWNGLITIKVRGFRFWNNEGSTGRSNMQLKCAVKKCCDRLQILILSLGGGVFSQLDRLLTGIWPWGIWHTVCHLWGMLQLLHWVLRVQFIISWGLFCLFHCDNIFFTGTDLAVMTVFLSYGGDKP